MNLISPLPPKQIFIIDDEEFHQDYLRESFKKLGYNDEQIQTFAQPDDLPKPQTWQGDPKVIVCDSWNEQCNFEMIQDLLAKLAQPENAESVNRAKLRLGFRSTNIGSRESNTSAPLAHNNPGQIPKSFPDCDHSVIQQLSTKRNSVTNAFDFFEAIAREPDLRAKVALLKKQGRQQKNNPINPNDIQLDENVLRALCAPQ